MADVKDPVQTYSRKAERLGEQIAQSKSDPRLVSEFVSAVRSQASEIAAALIEKSAASAVPVGRRPMWARKKSI